MPYKFAIVCEADADFRMASRLAERVIESDPKTNWLIDQIDNCSIWVEIEPGMSYLRWDHVKYLVNKHQIKVTAKDFRDEETHRAEDAKAGLRALRSLKADQKDLDFILLIRDDDRITERRLGLEQARNKSPWSARRVAIGLAHCKREAWILSGFEPSESELEKFDEQRTLLGFSPQLQSHRLTAKHDLKDKLNAKRVVTELVGNSSEREAACYEKPSLQTLKDRGQENGLAAFIAELEERLIPVIQDRKSAS